MTSAAILSSQEQIQYMIGSGMLSYRQYLKFMDPLSYCFALTASIARIKMIEYDCLASKKQWVFLRRVELLIRD